MKYIGVTIGMVFLLTALLALIAGGYLALGYVAALLGTLDAQIRVVVLLGSGVVLLAAVIIAQAVRSQSKTSLSTQAEKAGVYFELLAICARGRSAVSAELRDRGRTLVELERDLALIGGGRVVSTYLNLSRVATSGEACDEKRAALLKKLVTLMRRDLGTAGAADKMEDVLELVLGHPAETPAASAERT